MIYPIIQLVFCITTIVSGWWFLTILKKLVNGKDYPVYYGKTCSKPPTSSGVSINSHWWVYWQYWWSYLTGELLVYQTTNQLVFYITTIVTIVLYPTTHPYNWGYSCRNPAAPALEFQAKVAFTSRSTASWEPRGTHGENHAEFKRPTGQFYGLKQHKRFFFGI